MKNGNIEAFYPLSPMQQGMYFHSELAPGTGAYIEQMNCVIEGDLAVEHFIAACQKIVDRHTILRTAFAGANQGKLLQVVGKKVKLPFEILDWSDYSEKKLQFELTNLQSSERNQGFELGKAPLMRVKLIRLAQERYRFIWTHHHLLLDGWSVPIVLQEVFLWYENLRQGKVPVLPEPRPFRDYIGWLKGQDMGKAEIFWRKTLEGISGATEIPKAERTESNGKQENRSAELRVRLEAEESRRIREYGQRAKVTVNTIIQGAWSLVLGGMSGERDVMYGATVSGRPAEMAGAGEMVGLFINTLPVRVRIEMEAETQEWLRGIQEEQTRSREYEYSPLTQIQKWAGIGVERKLFESILVFENYPIETALKQQPESLKINDLNLTEQSDLPLTIVCDLREILVIRFKYNESVFSNNEVKRLIEYFSHVIKSLSESSSEKKVKEISLISNEEKTQIIAGWNASERVDEGVGWVVERISEQARVRPRAIAVQVGERLMSYEELESKSNQLARYLRAAGVRSESRVGVLLERSAELVVSLLGVLKAGGGYVPLDPGYPVERLRYMALDAGMEVVISRGGEWAVVAGEAGQEGAVRVVDWETEAVAIGRQSGLALSGAEVEQLSGQMMAYMIYTSGSTGKPKGAVNTHEGMLNRLEWMRRHYEVGEADRILQKTPFSFDVSVWELFVPLMAGGRLVMAVPGGHRDSRYLVREIIDKQITMLHFVPSMLQVFIEEEGVGECRSVRQIISSGEALTGELAAKTGERLGGASLDNLYGPTEAAVDVTFWRCPKQAERVNVPIGKALDNVRMYVLDERFEVVPTGVRGELFIGGVQVGRGYWGKEELTAEKFVPDPYGKEGGGRMYRTGDYGRYDEDGVLEYLGRIDEQVKIRGNRIEIGEIEAVLEGCAGVRQAVVKVWGERGSEQLVGYLVRQAGEEIETGRIRAEAGGKLPEYMIPGMLIGIEEMPLSVNGKVDRKRLPKPAGSELKAGEYAAAETATERKMVEVWEEVLAVKPIGINDNFFLLGGDSIRSLQIRALLRKSDINVSLHNIFQFPTIRSLAGQINNQGKVTEKSEFTLPFSLISDDDRKLLPENVVDAYPLTYMQSGMLFHSVFDSKTTAYHNITSYHLNIQFEIEKLTSAINEVINRHPVLRTSFDLSNFSEPLQLVYKNVPAKIDFSDLRGLENEEQEKIIKKWIQTEKQTPFNLSEAGLIRFKVHLRSEKTFQFSFSEHHAIVDGWSVATMMTELFTLYFDQIGIKPAQLKPLPQLSYRDFVAAERKALESDETKSFWLKKVENRIATEIPRWGEKYREPNYSGNRVKGISLSKENTRKIKELASKLGVPVKSVLLASHLFVLSVICGQKDILTGLVSNGRLEENDSERVLGLFLNTLPFRIKLKSSSWSELITEVFRLEKEILPHRWYPMAQLQKNFKTPLFETDFDFTHFHVYHSLEEFKGILLNHQGYEETNFTLTANFSLDLNSDQIWLSLYYLPKKISSEQIENISQYYLQTLGKIAENSEGRYEEFSPLSDHEREQIRVHWNATEREYESKGFVIEQISRQAIARPESIALQVGEKLMTYGELQSKSNQLARFLRSLGVRSESRVGVLLERSAELVVSLLGVLKAGGGYVPLDPGYPVERLRYMAFDAGMEVVISRGGEWAAVAGEAGQVGAVRVVDWETAAAAIGRQSGLALSGAEVEQLSGQMMAYMIYTSGSTGKPKGVQISHHALANFINSMKEQPGICSADKFLSVTSLSFDIAGLEIYLPLVAGAELIIAEKKQISDPTLLINLIETSNPTMMQATPSLWRLLTDSGWNGKNDLKILCGGEPLPIELSEKLLSKGSEIWNMYGPTETTIWSSICKLQTDDEFISIGKPIANTRMFIVDENMNPVPYGTQGELLIGGDGLARGYFKRPAITAENFIPNPFSTKGGKRLYRTGDIARYSPDGKIELLGRIDYQVKISGHRIELGEIESALIKQQAIKQAVVVARGGSQNSDSAHNKKLIAYLKLNSESDFNQSEIYQFLKATMPDYMIPSAFVILDEFPLTPNGKIDRNSLPEPDNLRPELEVPHLAPRNKIEQTLAQLWEKVLGIKNIGILDNYFELGGDSIASLQIAVQAKQNGIELKPEHLFNYQNIKDIAEVISLNAELVVATHENEIDSSEPFQFSQLSPKEITKLIQNHPEIEDIYPLSPMQQGMFFNQLFKTESDLGIELITFQIDGYLNLDNLKKAWDEIVSRHTILRTKFIWEGLSYSQQVVLNSVELIWDEVDLTDLSETGQNSKVEQIIEEERSKGFELGKAPLMRVKLIRLARERFHFIWTHHHLLLDGWSVPIVLREVFVCYESFLEGTTAPLPEPRPFRDYIGWLNRQDLGKAEIFWRETLQGMTGATQIPKTERARTNAQPLMRSAELRVRLGAAESVRIREYAQREKVTINTIIQGAWGLVLSGVSGEADVVYGATVSGRPAELAGAMVGLFINTLPVRVRVELESETGEWLRGIQQEQIKSREYEYSPLTQIQKWAAIAADRKLFESILVFENYPFEEVVGDERNSLKISKFMYLDPPQSELLLMVVPGNEILLRLMFSPDKFTEMTGQNLLTNLEMALISITRSKHQKLRDLSFIKKNIKTKITDQEIEQSLMTDEFAF